jgi:hypothetical protein
VFKITTTLLVCQYVLWTQYLTKYTNACYTEFGKAQKDYCMTRSIGNLTFSEAEDLYDLLATTPTLHDSVQSEVKIQASWKSFFGEAAVLDRHNPTFSFSTTAN